MEIIIYSKDYCPFCDKAKAFFDDLGLKYKIIDITNDISTSQKMIEITHRKTVPQIFINDYHVGGYTDLIELSNQNKLMELVVKDKKFSITEEF